MPASEASFCSLTTIPLFAEIAVVENASKKIIYNMRMDYPGTLLDFTNISYINDIRMTIYKLLFDWKDASKMRQSIYMWMMLTIIMLLQGCADVAMSGVQAVYNRQGIQKNFKDQYATMLGI